MNNDILKDLLAHQAWADAEHWKALEAYPSALPDPAISRRLNHIYETELAFFIVVSKNPFDWAMFKEETDMAELKNKVQHLHGEYHTLAERLSHERLFEELTIPWFKDPPLRITGEYALVQVAMHSQYHRAQNASRLRELGGTPPVSDFIAWVWKGKPEAAWK